MICPNCKSSSRNTVKRKPFLKLVPRSRSYSCVKCNTKYTWFPFLNKSIEV